MVGYTGLIGTELEIQQPTSKFKEDYQVNLATPSIGGTMNIITDPTSFEKGGKFKQEAGEGGFMKTTFNYNTGLILNDKLALSGTIVRKTGDGIIDGTWTDAWHITWEQVMQ